MAARPARLFGARFRGLLAGALAATIAAGCWLWPGSGPATLIPGIRECLNIEAALCAEVAAGATGAAPEVLVAWRVQCAEASCTPEGGSADVVVLFTGGIAQAASARWAGRALNGGALEFLKPPVPPTCLGVGREQCESEWETSTASLTVAQINQIIAIRVACNGVCDATTGEGSTTVVLRDGSELAVGKWAYKAAPTEP